MLRLLHGSSILVILTLLPLITGCSREPTVLGLVQEGNRYVGEDCRDKVVEIRSDRSVGSLDPQIWYVVYYDPDATFKATEVKLANGKKLDVNRPWRVMEVVKGEGNLIEFGAVRVGATEAIRVASKESLLENLTLEATQVWLNPGAGGPVWKVRLWAQKLRRPNEIADIGDVYVSATDAKVTRTDLHIERVD